MSINPDFYGSMNRFFNEVRSIFTEAQQKGYSRGAEGDGRYLLDFIKTHFGDHATGEAVYKLVRWQKKRDPKDLFKAAAWIFLIWDQYRRGGEEKIPTMTYEEAMDTALVGNRRMVGTISVGGLLDLDVRLGYGGVSAAPGLSASQQQLVSILDEIAQEAERAEQVHTPMFSQTQLRRLKVLRGEVGEVEQEVLNIHGLQNRPDSRESVKRKLRTELVQLAAVCANWIKNLPNGR